MTATDRAIVEACVGQRTIFDRLLNGERASNEQKAAEAREELAPYRTRARSRNGANPLTEVVGQLRGNWRPIVMGRTSGSVGHLRSVAPAVASADHSASMADGASGHADTINSGPKRAASQANLREHTVRLRNRRWCYRVRRSCDGYEKAGGSN